MADAKNTTIYALIDPRDSQARYVGKTVQKISVRLAAHICHAKIAHTKCARWICGLIDAGLRPDIQELEVVDDDWQSAEQFWIAYFRYIGCELTNHTAGGDGLLSFNHSKSARDNMSLAQKERYKQYGSPLKGRSRPDEVCEKISIAHKGRNKTQEQKEKIRISLLGRKLSDETKAKISASNKGRRFTFLTPETVQLIAEKNRGRRIPDDVRARMSESQKGRVLTEEHRRKISEGRKRYLQTLNKLES